MDTRLIAAEVEMILLAKLLEQEHVNACSNLQMPSATLLYLLRNYLEAPELSFADLNAGVAYSPVLQPAAYQYETTVQGLTSAEGVRLSVHLWERGATNRAPFVRRLQQHTERPRPALAGSDFSGGRLGLRPTDFEVRNVGYGRPEDIRVLDIKAPDWVCAQWEGNRVSLSSCPAAGGVYCGTVQIETSSNPLIFAVIAESGAFPVPARDDVAVDELLPDHPDLDRPASEKLLEEHLTRLYFERIPGGVFMRRQQAQPDARVQDWWLSEAAIQSGTVPAAGYPEHFTVYADADGRTDKYQVEVDFEHGQLGGELVDLFDLVSCTAGQKMSLQPYLGGYKASFSPAEPWRMARGHTYWLQGPREAVLERAEVLTTLLSRSDDRNITVNVLLHGEGELPSELVRQHRSGRLTVRWSDVPLPLQLTVCGERQETFVPPHGPLQRSASLPVAVWERSAPLLGRDLREQAWKRQSRDGHGDDGLLDLELSVGMERLAEALKAMKPGEMSDITSRQFRAIRDRLPREARRVGVDKRPVLAAPLLDDLEVLPSQINVHALNLRVTAGGYLVRHPQTLGSQKEWARYIGQLYGGVIHHSQLRKLVEAYAGQALEATSFVAASLPVLGWAGNGYRRPMQEWEPSRRELSVFAREAVQHFQSREKALDWLRRHVAVSEEQLAREMSRVTEVEEQVAEPRVAAIPEAAKPEPVRVPTIRSALTFAELPQYGEILADPLKVKAEVVYQQLLALMAAEGPMTESWLFKRYGKLSKRNPKQLRLPLIGALEDAVKAGELERREGPDGHIDYRLPGQQAEIRQRGGRSGEDITVWEWCAVMHALGLTRELCEEARAFDGVVQAYGLGTAANRARSLITHAWQTTAE